jgi:hypothetical protein
MHYPVKSFSNRLSQVLTGERTKDNFDRSRQADRSEIAD